MGIFGRLFGPRGPRRPPAWARGFGDDGEAFAAFTAVVCDVLAAEGIPLDGDSLRSGSLMLELDDAPPREWIVHELAARCAAAPRGAWFELVRRDFRGEPAVTAADRTRAWRAARGNGAGAPQDEPAGPWRGGVVLECGHGRSVLIALPVSRAADAATIRVSTGRIAAVIACNTGDGGHLAGAALARAAHLDHVLAIDAARPVDRPAAGDVAVRPLTRTRVGDLTLEVVHGCVRVDFPTGKVGLFGPAIPLSLIARVRPAVLVGLIEFDEPHADLVDWMLAPGEVVLMANAIGFAAQRTAEVLATMGVSSRVMHADADAAASGAGQPDGDASAASPDAEGAASAGAAAALSPEDRAIVALVSGDLETAAQIARAAVDESAHAARAHYTLAMIALLRGDEDAALDELAQAGDDPEALHSRAQILARRGEAAARDLAERALAVRPDDPLIVVGAIRARAVTGDAASARALYDAHAAAMAPAMRAQAKAAVETTPGAATGGHQFPHLGATALRFAEALVTAGDLATAEPILRRAMGWAPDDVAIAGELGFVLAQRGRDDDAIAHYDRAIARGGPMELLRFNRANAALRRRNFDDAIADLHACIALVDTWLEPRVNLVSALHAAGNERSARAALAELKARGGATEHVRALEAMLDRRR